MADYFIFDFDSTLTKVEALDYLAELTLEGSPDKDSIVNQIKNITDLGIDGSISFTESLERRIKLLNANKSDLDVLVNELKLKLSKSVIENKSFFLENKDKIKVVSCGFKEFIDPIVEEFGITSENVFANTFKFDENAKIVGFDTENVLAKHNGKIACLRDMNLEGEVFVIGDGHSDYVTKEAGVAHKFFAYTENVIRENILEKADHVTASLDEFLYVNKLPMNYSYPKSKIKILLLENIHPNAKARLEDEGFTVETANKSLSEEELIEQIKDMHVLGVRSKTQVTRKVVESANKLMSVCAFCIGTKQIDLEACQENGVVVFNAPYSNTRSVVELSIGQMIMLMRSTFKRSTELHNGLWNKTAEGSNEIRGKKLGIIGYGNIGKQVSVLAESLGVQVFYYDVLEKLSLGNATKCNSLKELMETVDMLSVHVDDNSLNKNLIGEKELSWMKPGSVFINLSRGFVVDLEALADKIKTGHIRGAAVDVYPVEPRKNNEPFDSPLKGLDNVILTPHVGGSTIEAQRHIAQFVPDKIKSYMNTGNTIDSVNFPNIQLPEQNKNRRFLHIHNNVPGVMAEVNKVLAKYELNIEGQYLKTNEKVGYLIADVDKDYPEEVIDALKSIPNTIRFRVLY